MARKKSSIEEFSLSTKTDQFEQNVQKDSLSSHGSTSYKETENGSNLMTKTPSMNQPSGQVNAKNKPRTRVLVKYDVGFNNTLFIRGKGADLSWDIGTPLKNVKNDEWVWETDASFHTCEFKVLINDTDFELGENHPISCGASVQYTPNF